jgi:hypothetical protein
VTTRLSDRAADPHVLISLGHAFKPRPPHTQNP